MRKIQKEPLESKSDLAKKGFDSLFLAGKHLFPFESQSQDPVLFILKGHLVIEEMLQKITQKKCLRPQILDNAKLTFHQSLCIAKAFYKSNNKTNWLWDAIEKLNNIRNRLAHDLEPRNKKEIIDDFVAYIEKHQRQYTPDKVKRLLEKFDPHIADLYELGMAAGVKIDRLSLALFTLILRFSTYIHKKAIRNYLEFLKLFVLRVEEIVKEAKSQNLKGSGS